MLFFTTFLTFATGTTAISIQGSPLAANLISTQDYPNALLCAAKNPSINTLIQSFCHGPGTTAANDLVVGSARATNGLIYEGIKIRILGDGCPSNSVWVPGEYCGSQFHYLCGVFGNADGVGELAFGANLCQTWRIERELVPGLGTWVG
ncbi:hypothetical protein LTR62_003625 [Meristemomyces frigidus]|uniref:Uncharacterized protein n=1 Tax=Meristemomyces frigidus TaxID=1508187 RepID=A0AAN7TF87_9PEZI|nr:hypothetical protein LTR62_003625 [Meristemomyces frigidus]